MFSLPRAFAQRAAVPFSQEGKHHNWRAGTETWAFDDRGSGSNLKGGLRTDTSCKPKHLGHANNGIASLWPESSPSECGNWAETWNCPHTLESHMYALNTKQRTLCGMSQILLSQPPRGSPI
ncbi:transmembrane protein 245 [Platysternon megacephalum]|uniref:Transmembrane protein 245 n=1 Tax=Platysternon megacephalum TaxID=55544 RepID=A0A4D9EKQ3_9SAUR|nr:transmembrane protein 245 [Platysternon megacephalum]